MQAARFRHRLPRHTERCYRCFSAHDKRYDTVTRLVSQYQDECSLTAGGLEVPQLQGRAPAPMTAQKWSCEVGKYLRGYSKNKYSAPERSHQTFTRTSQYRKFPGRGFHKYLKQGQSLSRIWRTRPYESTKQRSAAGPISLYAERRSRPMRLAALGRSGRLRIVGLNSAAKQTAEGLLAPVNQVRSPWFSVVGEPV